MHSELKTQSPELQRSKALRTQNSKLKTSEVKNLTPSHAPRAAR
jgi:hypothetical protein